MLILNTKFVAQYFCLCFGMVLRDYLTGDWPSADVCRTFRFHRSMEPHLKNTGLFRNTILGLNSWLCVKLNFVIGMYCECLWSGTVTENITTAGSLVVVFDSICPLYSLLLL